MLSLQPDAPAVPVKGGQAADHEFHLTSRTVKLTGAVGPFTRLLGVRLASPTVSLK